MREERDMREEGCRPSQQKSRYDKKWTVLRVGWSKISDLEFHDQN